MEERTQILKNHLGDKAQGTCWPTRCLEMKERHFNTKCIYCQLSQFTMHTYSSLKSLLVILLQQLLAGKIK